MLTGQSTSERPFLLLITSSPETGDLFAGEWGSTTTAPANMVLIFILDSGDRTSSPEQFWRVLFKLSPGESAVAALLVSGLSQQQIATSRSVSHETIRAQIKRIYEKIGANNQSQAVSILMKTAPVEVRDNDPN
jgi:DNA-binding CsgD family transcriptional regulator